jgi:hypothetical protein
MKGEPKPEQAGWAIMNGSFAANELGEFRPDYHGHRFTLAEAETIAPSALTKLRSELERQNPKETSHE